VYVCVCVCVTVGYLVDGEEGGLSGCGGGCTHVQACMLGVVCVVCVVAVVGMLMHRSINRGRARAGERVSGSCRGGDRGADAKGCSGEDACQAEQAEEGAHRR
jgi:hypothetical protein